MLVSKCIFQKSQGFSYLDVVFSLLILVVSAMLLFPFLERQKMLSDKDKLFRAQMEIIDAIDMYKRFYDEALISHSATSHGYPKNISVLVDGMPGMGKYQGSTIYFLREIPQNPFQSRSRRREDQWEFILYDDTSSEVYDVKPRYN